MKARLEVLGQRILDHLVDAPGSVASLYFDLALSGGGARPDVREVMGALDELESKGHVQCMQTEDDGRMRPALGCDRMKALSEYGSWLPLARQEDAANDEIGLWYAITDRGRRAWELLSRPSRCIAERWAIDDDVGSASMRVVAADRATAESALAWWLDHNPNVEVSHRSVELSANIHYVLRDGSRIESGVIIRVQYVRRGL